MWKLKYLLLLISFLLGFDLAVSAQSCCYTHFQLFVSDEEGKILNDAKVRIYGEDVRFNSDTNAFSKSSLGGCNVKNKISLNVKAKNFAEFNEVIETKSGFVSYKLRLNAKRVAQRPVPEELAVFAGVVKDQNDALIPNTKVTLTNKKGIKFEIRTNENGRFRFDIESGNYNLEFVGPDGFKKKRFEYVVISKGYKYFEVVLEVLPCSDCELILDTTIKKQ